MSALQLIGGLSLFALFLVCALILWGMKGLDDQGEEIDERGDE